MKQGIKNFLKAMCYIIFFYGMQLMVNVVIQFWYGFKVGSEAAAMGVKMDAQAITNSLSVFIAENQNVITLISGIVSLLALWLFLVIRRKKMCLEARINKFDKKGVLPIIILGGAASFFVTGVMMILPVSEELLNSYASSSQGLLNGGIVMRILSVVVVAPIVEEVFFRGMVISRLKRSMAPWVAIVVSSLVFGILHGQLLWIIYTFALGVLLGVVAERMKSVSAAILLHMAFNLAGVCVDSLILTNAQMYVITVVSLGLVVGSLYYIFKKKVA